jgi:hypothetical protein
MKAVRFFTILGIMVASMGVAQAQYYPGTYQGTFSGDDTGFWQIIVNDSLRADFYFTTSDGEKGIIPGSLNGTSGSFSASHDTVSISGKIDADGKVTGTWYDGETDSSGTFKGYRLNSPSPEVGGVDITADLWARAVLQVSGSPVTLKWKLVGADITPSGDQVISGYFYADPADFAYGSEFNPEVFVKIYIAKSGWCNIAFNHVTVDDVTVSSAHHYGGAAQQTATAKLTNRLVQHQYDGVEIQNIPQADGTLPPSDIDAGYTLSSGLWGKAVLQPSIGPVTLIWKEVGADTTPSGDKVVSGYFYADPADFAYGSEFNPEVFVKIYIAKSGWCNIAFNHVTVDNVSISSAHNYAGSANQSGIAGVNSRLVEDQYDGVIIGGESEAKPNLKPYLPSGWSEAMVVSTSTGTNTNASVFYETDTIYLDWAILNDGNVVAGPCTINLLLDGAKIMAWTTSELKTDYYTWVSDYSLGTLSAGTHTLKVMADSAGVVNECNESDNTSTKTISVYKKGTVPGAPIIGSATAGDGRATVTFAAPASTGSGPITGYIVTTNPGGKTGTGTASPISVTGLINGTAYTFTVKATNAAGTGPASAASNSVTPKAAVANFNGTWKGLAVNSTAKDYSGFPCGTGELTFTINNNQLTGKAVNSYFGYVYTLKGTVGNNGAVTMTVVDGDEIGASLSGTLSGSTGNGSWSEPEGCRGTWSATKQ